MRAGPLTLLLASALAPSPAAQDPPERLGEFLRGVEQLASPSGAAWGPDGQLWIAEAGAHRVSRFNRNGALLGSFGRRGSGPGELLRPADVALARTDEGTLVLVADAGNHRVQVFTPEGDLVRSFGGLGDGRGELRRPLALALDGATLWVADTGNHRLQTFALDGTPLAVLGARGGEPGAFLRPGGIAIDRSGAEPRIVVADTGNQRVQVLDADGEPLHAWGDRGGFRGLFAEPAAVDCAGGRVFVADTQNHRVQVFRPDGTWLYEWGIHVLRPGEGEGRLHFPSGIALAADGARAAVCEGFQDRAQIFGEATGPPAKYVTDPTLGSSGKPDHFGPRVATTGDLLLLAEPGLQTLQVYDVSGSMPIHVSRLGSFGEKSGRFQGLSGFDLAADGWRLVAGDRDGRRLQEFALDHREEDPALWRADLPHFVRGADLDRVLAAAGADAAFAGPVEPGALRRDGAGHLWIVDLFGERVVVFDRDFRPLRAFGDAGPDRLRGPADLALDEERGRVYVTESDAGRVQVFDLAGERVGVLGEPDRLDTPWGVAVGADGSVYVSDAGRDRIARFDAGGALLAEWGGRGLGAGELFKPRGLAVDHHGRLIAVDHGNHRVQIFTADGGFLLALGPRLYTLPTRDAPRATGATNE